MSSSSEARADELTLCGVGVLFNPALADFVIDHATAVDYLAVIPDRFWIDHGCGAPDRFEDTPGGEAVLTRVAGSLPIVLHGIGLSICSADIFDREYVGQLERWRARYECRWVSEHLSFSRIGAGHEANAGVALPIPYDREMLNLLTPRIQAVRMMLDCPFLLENNVSYVTFADEDLTEAQFLNELARSSGCSMLLDLHNVYTNARNHGFAATSFLTELDLSHVIEVHVAGGSSMMGFYTDSHTGGVPDPVWELLSIVAARGTRLRGVTFEFHESSWPLLRADGVMAQIDRARSVVAAARRM